MNKKEVISYIDSASFILVTATLFIFPVFFLINTSDFFVLPKQILVTLITVVLMVLWGVKIMLNREVAFRSSAFNFPVFLFGAITLLTALLARNTFDSLLQAVPLVFVLIFYFALTNSLHTKSQFNVALSALALGGVVSSLLSLIYLMNLFILPFSQIQNRFFTTLGSPIQHIIYLLPILALSVFYVYKRYTKSGLNGITSDYNYIIHLVSSFLILAGVGLNVYKIFFRPEKPIVLPFQYGIQIAMGAISQDSARQVLSLLFGSGYGTFLTDFARFKPSSFNLEENIWNLTFSFSSSYFLELIATVGILGTLAFLFIFARVIQSGMNRTTSPLFLAVIVTFILSFLLPFSYTVVFLMFALLGFYSVYLFFENDKRVYNLRVNLVALKEGLFSVNDEGHTEPSPRKGNGSIFPALIMAVVLIPSVFVGWYTVRLFLSDMKFTESLSPQVLNNGQRTYDLEREALQLFPYRSDYYRIFSQVNIALANSLINSIPQGQQPTQEAQQTVIALLQQSINSGRAAVRIAPLNPANWENLARIYRSLINVGQNAEQFAAASLNQAIALNQYDPTKYVELGGIFYQLGQFDAAQQQFQQAINLKPDYANAYYNLGHALQAKGDFQNALIQFNVVKELSKDDPANLEQIEKEIKALQESAGNQGDQTNTQPGAGNDGPLQVNQPQTQIPAQGEPVEIPAPPTEGQQTQTTPAPTAAPTQ